MNVRVASVSIAIAAAIGCSTIRNARDAQDSVAAKGLGATPQVSKVDFRGRSLEWLVGFAMSNRPSVVAARLEVEDARLAMKTIAADAPLVSETPWTALSLSASGGHSEASAGTALRDHDFSTRGSASASLSLNLLVWDFGRYGARARAQAEAVVAAEISLLREGFLVFEEVASSYFTFLEKNSLLDVALTNQAQYAERLFQAERRLDAGEADRLDVLKARLDLARSRQTAVAASNLVATSGARLMDALGVDASHGTCEEAFGHLSFGMDEVVRAFERTGYGVGEVFDFARTNAPSVQAARARLRAASHAVDYAIADMMPEVSTSASLRWSDPLWFWQWGVSAAQSLFQGFRRTTAVDRAVVAMRMAEASVDEAEQSLSANLESAVAVRDNSVEALRCAVASVRSAKENLDTAQEQLLVGSVSRVELSDAIASYSSALGDCIVAFYDGQRAEAALFALVGRFPVYSECLVKGGGNEE